MAGERKFYSGEVWSAGDLSWTGLGLREELVGWRGAGRAPQKPGAEERRDSAGCAQETVKERSFWKSVLGNMQNESGTHARLWSWEVR